MKTIMMTKEVWMGSYFSVARFYGGVRIDGHEYLITGDKDDLVRADFIKYFKKLGREAFIQTLERYNTASEETLRSELKKAIQAKSDAFKAKETSISDEQG